MREEELLRHLPALGLRLSSPDGIPAPGDVAPATHEEVIADLRAAGRTLIYDAVTRTVTAKTDWREKIRIA